MRNNPPLFENKTIKKSIKKKMKTTKTLLGLLLCVLPLAASAQNNFAYVNTQEIMMVSPEYKTAMTKLESTSKQYEDQLLKLNQEGQKKLEEYQKLESNPATDQTILKDKRDELAALDQRIQNFRQNATESVQKAQETEMMPVINKIRTAINDVANAQGIDYVVEEGSLIFHSTKAVNITAAVRKALGIPSNATPYQPGVGAK
jgi:outer membrane protein